MQSVVNREKTTQKQRNSWLSPKLRWYVRLTWPLVGVPVGLLLAARAVFEHRILFIVLELLHYNDFGKFYYSARQWAETGAMYGPSPATLIPLLNGGRGQFWNMNPPHFHLLFWPLFSLPVGTAYLIWTVLNVIVFVTTLIVVVRTLRIQLSVPTWAMIGLAAMFSAPVLAWSITGQLTGLLFGATTWVWLQMRRERWTRAAVAIGLLCSVKPFLGTLFLYLIIRRQFRAVFTAALAAVTAFAVGVATFGIQAHRDWLHALADVTWTGAAMNASVYGLIGRTWSLNWLVAPAAIRVSGLVALIVLARGMLASLRARTPDHAMLVVLLTALLASPLGWIYYVPILIGPAMALSRQQPFRMPLAIAALAFMIRHTWLLLLESRLFAATIGSVHAWALIGLWAFVTALAFRREERVGSVAFSPSRTVLS
jgi:hypothetical protein